MRLISVPGEDLLGHHIPSVPVGIREDMPGLCQMEGLWAIAYLQYLSVYMTVCLTYSIWGVIVSAVIGAGLWPHVLAMASSPPGKGQAGPPCQTMSR